MIIHVDLHTHSDLSPCGDSMMTPGTLLGIAKVNGLDAVAITDHNASYNIPAALKIAEAYDIVLVPGMELETSEEIHVVCLFPTYEQLAEFQKTVCDSYTPPDNRPEIFGEQHIYNEEDEIVGEWKPLLLASTGISIDDVPALVEKCGGLAYPAHVDRDSYSVLTTFGMLPEWYNLPFVEVSCDAPVEEVLKQYPFLKDYKLLRSSDAHYHHKIQETGAALDVDENTAAGVIKALRQGRIVG